MANNVKVISQQQKLNVIQFCIILICTQKYHNIEIRRYYYKKNSFKNICHFSERSSIQASYSVFSPHICSLMLKYVDNQCNNFQLIFKEKYPLAAGELVPCCLKGKHFTNDLFPLFWCCLRRVVFPASMCPNILVAEFHRKYVHSYVKIGLLIISSDV